MKKLNYIKNKRNKSDYCNICGELRDLTWDHVPPQGITHGEAVIVNTVFKGMPEPNSHMKRYQNGIKYRSICGSCNNDILGVYDKEYKQFTADIENNLPMLINDGEISISIQVNKVCRAMIGHLLAARSTYESSVIADKLMREYVLDSERVLSKLNLYMWAYPYESIIIARDFTVAGNYRGTHPKGFVSGIVLSYPLAYMVSDGEGNCAIDNLGQYTTSDIEYSTSVTLHSNTLFINGETEYKSFNWPIDVSDGENKGAAFVLGGQAFQEDSRLGISPK